MPFIRCLVRHEYFSKRFDALEVAVLWSGFYSQAGRQHLLVLQPLQNALEARFYALCTRIFRKVSPTSNTRSRHVSRPHCF